MKKLILVTTLAIAASWLLAESRSMDPATLESVAMPEIVASPEPVATTKTVLLVRDEDRPSALFDGPPRKARPGKPAPSWFPRSEADEEAKARADSFGSRVLLGRLSASEDRARADLRTIVEREVSGWLAADIPPSWKAPNSAIQAMVQGSFVQEVTKKLVPTAAEGGSPDNPKVDGLFTLYRAGQKLDFSATQRAEIVGIYRKELAAARMQKLGGGLALALVGLAVLSGYIKADEATRGYYTKRLRLAAAAGLGAAGVAAYRFLV